MNKTAATLRAASLRFRSSQRSCASATTSISTAAPRRSFATCTTERAGKFSWKYDQYVSFMMPQSFRSLAKRETTDLFPPVKVKQLVSGPWTTLTTFDRLQTRNQAEKRYDLCNPLVNRSIDPHQHLAVLSHAVRPSPSSPSPISRRSG